MDEEIYKVLENYKNVIDMLMNEIDSLKEQLRQMDAKIDNTNSVLYNDILDPAKEAMDSYQKEVRFDDFNSKYGERLGSHNDVLRKIEHDPDFDLTRTAFENYESGGKEAGYSDEEYVEALEKSVISQIDEMKSAFGIADDATVEVVSDGNGEEEVLVDGQPIEEAAATEEPSTKEPSTEETEEPSTEETEDYEKELAEQAKNIKRY